MTKGHELPVITCRELRTVQDSGKLYLIIDVRDEAEFEAGHVEESIHIPFVELRDQHPHIVHDKKELVIVVGSARTRPKRLGSPRPGRVQARPLPPGGFDEWCRPAAPTVDDILEDRTR